MSGFYYARFDKPRQFELGTIGDEPIYASCAQCGQEDAVIHGAILDEKEHRPAYVPGENGITFRYALYCEACFESLLREEERRSLLQELEILEERIGRQEAGLGISQTLEMENVAHLKGELEDLQGRHAKLLQQLEALG